MPDNDEAPEAKKRWPKTMPNEAPAEKNAGHGSSEMEYDVGCKRQAMLVFACERLCAADTFSADEEQEGRMRLDRLLPWVVAGMLDT